MRTTVDPPQHFADEHTLIAQHYAGYFIGHPYRAAQQKVGPGAIQVDATRAWKEPAVIADDCDFCRHLTDDNVIRRIAGYQHAIDIEVLRPHSLSYSAWLSANQHRKDPPGRADDGSPRGLDVSQETRRRFLEENADILQVQPIPMVRLPLRLKRKLCIEWNHLYRDWMRANPEITYDFESKAFFREVTEPEAKRNEDELKAWWQAYADTATANGAA